MSDIYQTTKINLLRLYNLLRGKKPVFRRGAENHDEDDQEDDKQDKNR